MKIDKKKLIQLLVEKTGMDDSEVEDQLQQLIDRIIDAAERGKALEIKEFGLFYFDEEGSLKFDPSKELSTEINFKYAGMEPVELKPPRGATETGDTEEPAVEIEDDEEDTTSARPRTEEEEEDLSAIFGFDEDEDAEEEDDEIELPWGDLSGEEEPEKQAHPASGSKSGTEPEEDEEFEDEIPERDEDPFAGLLGDASSKLSETEKGFVGGEEKPSHPLISGSDEPETPAPKKEKKVSQSKPAKKPEPEPKPSAESKSKPEPEQKPAAVSDKSTPKAEETKEAAHEKQSLSKPAAAATGGTDGKKPEASSVASGPAKKTPGYPGRKKSIDPIVIVIGIVLVFIIVAAAFLVIPGLLGDSETDTQGPASAEVTEQPAVNEGMNTEDNVPANDMESEPVLESESTEDEDLPPPEPETEEAVTDNVTADPVAEEAQADNGYGLRGALSEEANDGYSIVLHSLRQEASAESIAADLNADGYRAMITRRTVDGQSVWRVSVGQFETIADAQEAALTLPSPYNSNNFIQRIPTN
jgi:hypothetical protein